ncbi:MAG: hypothetical protein ACR2RF_28640 [Geminicoccaceae bacterium]
MAKLALAHAFDYESALRLTAITDEVAAGTAPTGAIPVGMYGANPAGEALKRDVEAVKAHFANC